MKTNWEAMFIDPITRFGYIIEKVKERNNKPSPMVLKVGNIEL